VWEGVTAAPARLNTPFGMACPLISRSPRQVLSVRFLGLFPASAVSIVFSAEVTQGAQMSGAGIAIVDP
jgi:hypothetical protein